MGKRLVHLWEQCLLTAGASGHCLCRVPVSLYPWCHVPRCLLTAGTRGQHCLCSTLSSSALKAVRSLIHLEEGIFTGGWLCHPHAACGTRVLFLCSWPGAPWLSVAGAHAHGHITPSFGRGECSRWSRPLFLGLPPGVTDMMEVGTSTSMGIALHHMWMVGFGGIRVAELSGKFTGAEGGTSFSCKRICPSPASNPGTYKN